MQRWADKKLFSTGIAEREPSHYCGKCIEWTDWFYGNGTESVRDVISLSNRKRKGNWKAVGAIRDTVVRNPNGNGQWTESAGGCLWASRLCNVSENRPRWIGESISAFIYEVGMKKFKRKESMKIKSTNIKPLDTLIEREGISAYIRDYDAAINCWLNILYADDDF